MLKSEVIKILRNDLYFDQIALKKLMNFSNLLLSANQKYNFISKSTENKIWYRHILDSAQLTKYIPKNTLNIADFGSGAGFPGIILSIYDTKNKFHVKLYEKSPVKRSFLKKMCKELNLRAEIKGNVYDNLIKVDLIVVRAFKKLSEIIKISRENCIDPHSLLILKGKNAKKEINEVSLGKKYSYKLLESITSNDSKIIQINAKK